MYSYFQRKDVFWDDGPDEKKLADLLELYLYLKVYSIWGTPAVNDIGIWVYVIKWKSIGRPKISLGAYYADKK